MIDLHPDHKVGDNLTLALNGDYGYEANIASRSAAAMRQWFGVAGYARRQDQRRLHRQRPGRVLQRRGRRPPPAGPRHQRFEATLGLSITPFPKTLGQNLVIRPEVRFDYAEDRVFNGDYNQFTFGLDAYFTF